MTASTTPARLNIKQLQIAFGISHMTAFNWRAGTTRLAAIPQAKNTKAELEMTRPPVTFAVSVLRAWAKKHGIEFAVDPDKVLKGSVAAKPGPRERKTVVVKKAVKAVRKAPSTAKKAATVAIKKAATSAKVVPIRKAAKPAKVVAAPKHVEELVSASD